MTDDALTPAIPSEVAQWSDAPTAPDTRVDNPAFRAELEEKARVLMETAGVRTLSAAMEIAAINADVSPDWWMEKVHLRPIRRRVNLRLALLLAGGAALGAALGAAALVLL